MVSLYQITTLILSLVPQFVKSQTRFYYDLSYEGTGGGTSCAGTGTVTSDGLDLEVDYNAQGIYRPEGWVKTKTSTNSSQSYRFTLCGILANSSCSGDYCFEEVNATNKDLCIEGLSRWEMSDNTTISYGVYFNETISNNGEVLPDKPIALHIQISNHNQYNKNCPNDESYISYDIQCDRSKSGTAQLLNLYTNRTNCEYNVTLLSDYGCVTTFDRTQPTSNGDNGNEDLSTGSVIVIIFVVVLLTYLILGCAYNSFYHGRVGFDALPNKNGWSQCFRFVKAGCETTYDTICCHQGNVEYQNL